MYNIGAKDMNIAPCFQTRCPPYRYQSNDINVGMQMLPLSDKEGFL